MEPVRALAMVAHPDDCVIFARPFIESHSQFDWSIMYMTYCPWEPRAEEMTTYWSKRNIPTTFLGFNDDWEYVKNGELGFSKEQALREIGNITQEYDLILTHHEDGDYGHIHHKLVNQATQQNTVPKVYFASTFNYNAEYFAREPLDLTELPLHAEVIAGFQDRDHGRYILTPQAERLINERHI